MKKTDLYPLKLNQWILLEGNCDELLSYESLYKLQSIIEDIVSCNHLGRKYVDILLFDGFGPSTVPPLIEWMEALKKRLRTHLLFIWECSDQDIAHLSPTLAYSINIVRVPDNYCTVEKLITDQVKTMISRCYFVEMCQYSLMQNINILIYEYLDR